MPSLEILIPLLLAIGVLGAGLTLAVLLTRRGVGDAVAALERGDFAAALEAGARSEPRDRTARLAGAIAARHLRRDADAERELRALLAADPTDGEAWLELGVLRAYRGAFREAEQDLARAAGWRADLTEQITLHRAWTALRAGDRTRALALFEEIAVPLETKLRDVVGPEPLFTDWYLETAALWEAAGETAKAHWAWQQGVRCAPASRLAGVLQPPATSTATAGRSGPSGGSPS